MARALLVGCGCRGRALGGRLLAAGWEVRGTTREPGRLAPIAAAGIEPVVADPDRVGSILDQIGDVAVVCWLLGSAVGAPGRVAAIHGPRLDRLLAELVDTPVRGFVYEAAGAVRGPQLERGAEAVLAAAERWRIPAGLLRAEPADHEAWTEAGTEAVLRLLRP